MFLLFVVVNFGIDSELLVQAVKNKILQSCFVVSVHVLVRKGILMEVF